MNRVDIIGEGTRKACSVSGVDAIGEMFGGYAV